MSPPGIMELLLILVIVLVLFGAGRIPGIAENLAKGIKSFKQGLKDEDDVTTKTPAKKINKKDE
jgi:sec-independent protein translocase protein TatA